MEYTATEQQKSVISEAIDLKMALQDILGMITEPTALSNDKDMVVPQSNLKLDNLRTAILDCKEITKAIGRGLRLLS